MLKKFTEEGENEHYRKYIKDLNIRLKTIKLLEENIGGKASNRIWQLFLGYNTKAKQEKKKN